MGKIIEVEFQTTKHLLHGVRVAIVQCRIRGNAWTYLIEERIARIVLHNLIDEELLKVMKEAGCDEFLAKPFRVEELLDKIQKYLKQ